jgi:predicted RND superfamily exporter protein
MKKFVITTTSESSDHYVYFIEHPKKPTHKQINEWLKENGTDIDEERCYEEIDEIEEITEFQKLD